MHPDTDAQDDDTADGVLDAEALDRLRELDPDGSRGFLAQVLRTYAAALERQLPTLAEACAQGDAKRAGEIAHNLKSSSASVGALRLSACCARVELLTRQPDMAGVDAAAEALQQEAAQVQQAVRAMLSP